jgi:G3E family GTPase
MNPIRLHLVAGFLGSGKTTAIANACKLLIRQNQRVGIVTNDQGKYLVDTAFFQLNDFPTVEVIGGCFCCNYSELEDQLDTLIAQVKPQVIFAESVGSCADMVATVIKPLLDLKKGPFSPTSFSVFPMLECCACV